MIFKKYFKKSKKQLDELKIKKGKKRVQKELEQFCKERRKEK
jgi:hypothetical protein